MRSPTGGLGCRVYPEGMRRPTPDPIRAGQESVWGVSLGASNWRIMTREIAPLVFPTIRTLAMLEVAAVILAAASLTFLGIGLQRPDVDW